MKNMSERKSIFLLVVYSYLLSIFVSLIFSPLFSFFYDRVLKPPQVGYGLFFGRGEEIIIGGIIFSYIFFLPLFILILTSKKQWLSWLIGSILPSFIFFSEKNYVIWFVIFTISGGLIGWLINITLKKLRK